LNLISTNNCRESMSGTMMLALVIPFVPIFAGALIVLLLALTGRHPLWPEVALTLSEAAALRDAAGVVRLVEDGHDPNERLPVRPGILKSYALVVSPLEAAVGARRVQMFSLLLGHGAKIDSSNRMVLKCFAMKERVVDIVDLISTSEDGAVEEVSCEEVRTPW
jgi:hypothetical protein